MSAPEPDVDLVVLDTAWTPGPNDPSYAKPLRPVVGRVLSRIDLYRDALARLEAWEEASDIADRMMVDGVSWWFRQRPFIWYLLHEHRLWLAILDELGARDVASIAIPADEPVLTDVAARLVATTGKHLDHTPPPVAPESQAARPGSAQASPPPFTSRVIAGLRRRIAPITPKPAPQPGRAARRDDAPRLAMLDERVAALGASAGRSVLVLSHPRVFQVVTAGHGPQVVDPQLAPVMQRLHEENVPIVHVALELDLRRDEDWPSIEADERLLPDSYIRRRWVTDDASEVVSAAVVERLRDARSIPLEVDGVDLAPALLARLEHVSGPWLSSQVRLSRGARRMFDELRPAAMFLNHEGIRTPWIAAARAVGVPIHAVQHGIIYPTHPVYRHKRHPGFIYPDRSYVYGPYERTVLLEQGAYGPIEVEVSGSPRLDLVGEPGPRERNAIREEIRESLGVLAGHRMLVLSTANHVLAWRFHIADAMARILGGFLADVHIVVKLHPGEKDDGPYRALISGLARSAGYPAPPITIVHDIDLFRLLQAADAHLGFNSTVLTDAVAAGTPNLIAAGHATADLLGYVEAGVARPVHDVSELRDALDDPHPPDPEARQAFLEQHFRPGDASARIAASILAVSTAVGDGGQDDMITIRPAAASDEDLLLRWANDLATRAAGFQPEPISPSEHHQWFTTRLSSASGRLFIGMSGESPVGQVRMDRDPDGHVEIGIAVAAEARGRGIGRALLLTAIDAVRHDEELRPTAFVARIRPENAASIALFTGAGFRPLTETEVEGEPCIVYQAEA